jgi:glycosyltransferase involved in cell wall biosynthesis
MGFHAFSKNKFAGFFQSIERQNYSNFHVVYVDDGSPREEIDGLV